MYYVLDSEDDDLDKAIEGEMQQLKFGSVPPIYASSKKPSKTSLPSQKDSVDASGRKTSAKVKVTVSKEGQVVQCIELPNWISTDYCAHSVTPVCGGSFVLVVMTPRCLNTRLNVLANGLSDVIDSANVTLTCDDASASNIKGGFFLLYRVVVCSGMTMLDSTPLLVSEGLTDISCAPLTVSYLPTDTIAHEADDEEVARGSDVTHSHRRQPSGSVIVTTVTGDVKLISLCDFNTILTIPAPAGDQYIDATFCSGQLNAQVATNRFKSSIHCPYYFRDRPSVLLQSGGQTQLLQFARCRQRAREHRHRRRCQCSG